MITVPYNSLSELMEQRKLGYLEGHTAGVPGAAGRAIAAPVMQLLYTMEGLQCSSE